MGADLRRSRLALKDTNRSIDAEFSFPIFENADLSG